MTLVFFALAGSWFIWRQGRTTTKTLLPLLVLIVGVAALVSMKQLQIMERLSALPLAVGVEYKRGSSLGLGGLPLVCN